MKQISMHKKQKENIQQENINLKKDQVIEKETKNEDMR